MLGLLSYLRARSERHAINEGSSASDPVGLGMSDAKLRRLSPSLYFLGGPTGFLRCCFGNGLGQRYRIRDVLVHGDSRAAVVVSESPLLVACYCDDLDGVCLLRFPNDLAEESRLRPGDHLLTVLNSLACDEPAPSGEVAPDLVQGSGANPCYVNFWPLVADFLSDDIEALAARKEGILPEEYAHCEALGTEHLRRFGGAARDGRPDRSMRPVSEGRLRRR